MKEVYLNNIKKCVTNFLDVQRKCNSSHLFSEFVSISTSRFAAALQQILTE